MGIQWPLFILMWIINRTILWPVLTSIMIVKGWDQLSQCPMPDRWIMLLLCPHVLVSINLMRSGDYKYNTKRTYWLYLSNGIVICILCLIGILFTLNNPEKCYLKNSTI